MGERVRAEDGVKVVMVLLKSRRSNGGVVEGVVVVGGVEKRREEVERVETWCRDVSAKVTAAQGSLETK